MGQKEQLEQLDRLLPRLVADCVRLVQSPTETPPSNTQKICDLLEHLLADIPGLQISRHCLQPPVDNLIAVLKNPKPGPRLVLNGHLDTYPAGFSSNWSCDPFGGEVKGGFIWGRGAADMKGGIACFITLLRVLADHPESWRGEVVLTLVGDEESMGELGTKYLLDCVEQAAGDVVLCADVGAPQVLRFGQKGLLWIKFQAMGKATHGAHVHKGKNAIHHMAELIVQLNAQLPSLPVHPLPWIVEAIDAASSVSEPLSGAGETEVLKTVTVNFGTIMGGHSPNLVPDFVQAACDIRMPAGITSHEILTVIDAVIENIPEIQYTIMRCYEANWTDLSHPIFEIARHAAEEILGKPVVHNYRVGASDARHYRLFKQIPAINCGLTSYGLGGGDERVEIEEMLKTTKIHLLTALEFLNLG